MSKLPKFEVTSIIEKKQERFEPATLPVQSIQNNFFKDNIIISVLEYTEKSIIHKLSHQHLHIKFWKVKIEGTIENGIDAETLRTFPFPIVIHNFIEKELN